MKYLAKTPWIAAALSLLLVADERPPKEAPPLEQVVELIRANLKDLTEAELNRAAVEGLMHALGPRAALLEPGAREARSEPGRPCLSRSTVFNERFGYLRVCEVAAGLARDLTSALEEMNGQGELEGLVLDLRFANGRDYHEAARVADRFVKTSGILVRWGDNAVKGSTDGVDYEAPVVVLMNRETSEAAEALAAMLREFEVALLLGNRSAGQANVYREFALPNGFTLRLAAESLRVADRVSLSNEGLKPDIAVNLSLSEEREYYLDPYADQAHGSGGAGGNGLDAVADRPVRMNEATLVRLRQQALDPDGATPEEPPVGGDTPPLVTDPALARAVDLLTGLSVMRAGRE